MAMDKTAPGTLIGTHRNAQRRKRTPGSSAPQPLPDEDTPARQLKLIIPGRYANVAEVCQTCADMIRNAGLDEDTAFHIEMAVDEACTNIIHHAYGGEGAGEIELSCRIENDQVIVTLHDHGKPFNPDAVPPPKIAETIEEVAIGGLGLYLMRKLMDEVRFEFDPREGNTLTMIKRTPRRTKPKGTRRDSAGPQEAQ